jgi:hypothetical protein
MPAAPRTRAQFAERIRSATRKTVEAMIEVGKLLIEAKAKLKHGEFIAMVRTDLPFKERTAQRLMAIAKSPVLANTSIQTLLPPHLHTLNDLAALPAEDFATKLAVGAIRPDMTQAEARDAKPVRLEVRYEERNDAKPVRLEWRHARHKPKVVTAEEMRQALGRAKADQLINVLQYGPLLQGDSDLDLVAQHLASDWRFSRDQLDQVLGYLTAVREALERLEAERRAARVVPLHGT